MNLIWTNSEKNYIKKNAAIKTDEELTAELQKMSFRHISLQSVRKQRRKLGILKCSGRGICKIKEQ